MTFEQLLPPALQEDLGFLFDTLEAVHPHLYYRTPAAVHLPQRRAVAQALSQPLTRRSFYRLVAPLVGSIADGHTLLHPPYAEYAAWNAQQGWLFPVDLDLDNTTATIRATYAENPVLPLGAELLAINGVAMTELLANLMRYAIGERPLRRLRVVQHAFRILYWAVYAGDHYTLDVRTTNGIQRYAVAGVSNAVITARAAAPDGTAAPAPYAFTSVPDASVGYFAFRVSDDLDRFRPFLHETFTRVACEQIQRLILDLRDNEGGSSDLGDALLAYLAAQPVQQYATMEVKVSEQIKAYYRRADTAYRSAPHYDAILDASSGTVLAFAGQPLVPEPNELRFHGTLYVLIGPDTYSAATMLAATVKDYQVGQLVGEETGGLATQYADIYPFELPNTGLRCIVSHKRFVRPSGIDDGKGVIPDIAVRADLVGAEHVDDAVLAQALAWVRERSAG